MFELTANTLIQFKPELKDVQAKQVVLILDMFDRSISIISKDAFADFINLKELYLNRNKLTIIDPHVLKPLTKLENLSLKNNQITKISEDAFADLSNLKELP